MLSEIIGLRKSMQNIDYKAICFRCNGERERCQINCPKCGVAD